MATEEEKDLTAAQVTEFLTFLKENDFSWNDYRSLVSGMKDMSEDEIKALDADGKLSELYESLNANPRFRNHNKRQEIARGIEGGIEALKTLSNISTARRQVDEAKRMENELVDPQAPPTTPKSQELLDATEMARRDMTQPMKEIDPLLQRNMDLLRSGMNVADVNSGGQAGLNASMKQNAINQARSANQQLIPQIEGIRRQKQAEYNRLISAGISEDDMRFKQQMQKYNVAENRYLTEAQAIGGLRAVGEENLFNQQNQLFDQAAGAVSGAVNYNYGGVGANEVNNQASNYQLNSPSELYDAQNAMNFQTGVQQNNINAAGNRFVAPKPFTAIGGLGQKWQDLSNKYDMNLEGWTNPNNRYGYNLKGQ